MDCADCSAVPGAGGNFVQGVLVIGYAVGFMYVLAVLALAVVSVTAFLEKCV